MDVLYQKLNKKNRDCLERIVRRATQILVELQEDTGYGFLEIHANMKSGEVDVVDCIGKDQFKTSAT